MGGREREREKLFYLFYILASFCSPKNYYEEGVSKVFVLLVNDIVLIV